MHRWTRAISGALLLFALATGSCVSQTLTDDAGFVFTHYEMSADTILLNRKPQAVKEGSFFLAAPGGNLAMGAHAVHASVSIIPQLNVGASYLLFLSLNGNSGAFQFIRPGVLAFRVDGGGLTRLNKDEPVPAEALLSHEANYLNAIRANIQSAANRSSMK